MSETDFVAKPIKSTPFRARFPAGKTKLGTLGPGPRFYIFEKQRLLLTKISFGAASHTGELLVFCATQFDLILQKLYAKQIFTNSRLKCQQKRQIKISTNLIKLINVVCAK